jgi:hypothetical protein
MPEVLASARSLDDSVERDELSYDDPSHLGPPLFASRILGTILNQSIDKPSG